MESFGYGTLLEDGRKYGPHKTQDSYGKDLRTVKTFAQES